MNRGDTPPYFRGNNGDGELLIYWYDNQKKAICSWSGKPSAAVDTLIKVSGVVGLEYDGSSGSLWCGAVSCYSKNSLSNAAIKHIIQFIQIICIGCKTPAFM